MWKCLLIVCFVGVLTLASPTRDVEGSVKPIHIIKPPVRCPEGMKPDANGRCRVIWERSVDNVELCPEGEESDENGVCREICAGDECEKHNKIVKRDVEEDETEGIQQFKNHRKMESLKNEKKNKKRSNPEATKQSRSKHAFLIMLKKKKMQEMMKPKPPPPHHHPPHHHPPHRPESEEEEEPEEEEPAEEQPEDPPQRLFFGDEVCVEKESTTNGCQPQAETVQASDLNKEFKEWKPEKSSESSSSSDSSSSSSDSTGESEGGSGESEDEVLEKAIKIKLMKLFRMRQMYGPVLRRWLLNQLREYDESLNN